MYFELIGQFKKQLGQIGHWLDLATTHARAEGVDPDTFLDLKLAPDQFAFARQVQIACDTAKFVASRLTGKEAPSHADTEKTIEELRARTKSVIAYLDGFTAADFADAATRVISTPRWEGKVMTGADYFREHGLPNFYFHVTHVYALLRHRGVPLGKRDYLGAVTLRDPAAAAS